MIPAAEVNQCQCGHSRDRHMIGISPTCCVDCPCQAFLYTVVTPKPPAAEPDAPAEAAAS